MNKKERGEKKEGYNCYKIGGNKPPPKGIVF